MGYLPQLRALHQQLQDDTVTEDDAQQRLNLLEDALKFLIRCLDETGYSFTQMGLDEVQQGTLGGFMMPVREGLEDQLRLIAALELDVEWEEDFWNKLMESQIKIQRGNQGVTYMTDTIGVMAKQSGVEMDDLFKKLAAPVPAAEPQAL